MSKNSAWYVLIFVKCTKSKVKVLIYAIISYLQIQHRPSSTTVVPVVQSDHTGVL